MTPRESECLAAIKRYWNGHGCSPSFGELTGMLGIASKSSVSRLVVSLESQGYLRRARGKTRSLLPVNPRVETAARAVVASGRPAPDGTVAVDAVAFQTLQNITKGSWHV